MKFAEQSLAKVFLLVALPKIVANSYGNDNSYADYFDEEIANEEDYMISEDYPGSADYFDLSEEDYEGEGYEYQDYEQEGYEVEDDENYEDNQHYENIFYENEQEIEDEDYDYLFGMNGMMPRGKSGGVPCTNLETLGCGKIGWKVIKNRIKKKMKSVACGHNLQQEIIHLGGKQNILKECRQDESESESNDNFPTESYYEVPVADNLQEANDLELISPDSIYFAPESEDLSDVNSMFADGSALLFSNDQCGETIDLCEDGTSCSGLKTVFLELCFNPEAEMTGCTSDCAFLLEKLRKEANKQGKAIECVDYVQNLPRECDNDIDREAYNFHSCPSEDGLTEDLQPGEMDSISCSDLYPSGTYGAGTEYRYCMLAGGLIETSTCQLMETVATSNTITSNSIIAALLPTFIVNGGSDLTKIRIGAEKGNDILKDSADLLKAAGDAKLIAEKIGKIGAKLGPALGAVGIVFDIVSLFIGKQESAELRYMKQQFAIVNEKIDRLSSQLADVETRILYEIFKADFRKYKAKLDSCGVRLRSFHSSPTENSRKSFREGCCTGDKNPLDYLNWMGLNAEQFINEYVAAKRNYRMETFLREVQGILHTTTTASYFHATCSGLDGLDSDTLAWQIQKGVDQSKKVMSVVNKKIAALPNDYINIQLRKDIVNIVDQSGNTRQCSEKLSSEISANMKGWRYRPYASAYCYGNVSGWNKHAVSAYSSKNEMFGFFYEFRINASKKYSVGVDWTNTPHSIDQNHAKNVLKAGLKYTNLASGSIGSKGISRMRELLSYELKCKHNLYLRNIAYVGYGNSARGNLYTRYQYWINLDPYMYSYRCGRGGRRWCSAKKYYSVIFSVWPGKFNGNACTRAPTPAPTRAPSSSCVSGSNGILVKSDDDARESVTEVRNLKVGDTVRGFDDKMKSTSCKIEAIGGFGYGEVYGNFTADHYVYDPQSGMVVQNGKQDTMTVTDKYDMISDCPLVEDESGKRFGPMDSDFCGGKIKDLSWKNYLILYKGILRVVRKTGGFWFDSSSYKNMEMVKKFAPSVCKNMLRCMKNNKLCNKLEKSSQKFINMALNDSAKKKTLKTFSSIGSLCEGGSVSAIVTSGESIASANCA